MFSVTFLKDAGERAGFTFLQALLGVMLAGGVFDLFNFDWSNGLTIAASATVLSFVKSLVANRVVDSSVSPASAASVVDDTL